MYAVEAEKEGILFITVGTAFIMWGIRLGNLVTITKYWSTDNVNLTFCKSEFHDTVKRKF